MNNYTIESMKTIRYALLGLICLVPLTVFGEDLPPNPLYEYHDTPTNGHIGIMVIDIKGKGEWWPILKNEYGYSLSPKVFSEYLYFISGYTYRYFQEKNKDNKDEYKVVLRIPEIDGKNRMSYIKILHWIGWTQNRWTRNETLTTKICENITTVPNKENPQNKDAIFTFKHAKIGPDYYGWYNYWGCYDGGENENKNAKIIYIGRILNRWMY